MKKQFSHLVRVEEAEISGEFLKLLELALLQALRQELGGEER